MHYVIIQGIWYKINKQYQNFVTFTQYAYLKSLHMYSQIYTHKTFITKILQATTINICRISPI